MPKDEKSSGPEYLPAGMSAAAIVQFKNHVGSAKLVDGRWQVDLKNPNVYQIFSGGYEYEEYEIRQAELANQKKPRL